MASFILVHMTAISMHLMHCPGARSGPFSPPMQSGHRLRSSMALSIADRMTATSMHLMHCPDAKSGPLKQAVGYNRHQQSPTVLSMLARTMATCMRFLLEVSLFPIPNRY